MLQLTLPPNRTPSIQPYARATADPVGLPISGTAVPGRSTLYNFDVSDLADGDYVVDILNPWGRFDLRKFGTSYFMADEWWELDYLLDPAEDPGKVLVNQDYGGPGALTYALDGIPVVDATIELFLYSDYMAGKRNGNFRINSSRQRVDGVWAVFFYLDPEDYVIRFYRSGVAGPDAWKVTVSFDVNQIVITPLELSGNNAVMLGAVALPPEPAISPTELRQEIKVDHNYGGDMNLVYKLNDAALDGATIQLFRAEDYNAGRRSSTYVRAQTIQQTDGTWRDVFFVPPGHYVLNCYKVGVAGPNAFNLTVE